jgi:hypothetical protein
MDVAAGPRSANKSAAANKMAGATCSLPTGARFGVDARVVI